jgi:hypothetical protein
MNAIGIVLTDYYMDYFVAFLNSMWKNSPKLLDNTNFVIVTNSKDIRPPDYIFVCGCQSRTKCTHQNRKNFVLSVENREKIMGMLPNVKFIDIDPHLFLGNQKLDPCYWSLTLFGLYQYDKVLYMDVDLLFLRDVSNLFLLDHNFSICNVRGHQTVSDLNGGLFLIGKEYLNPSMFHFLLEDSADIEKSVGPQESYKRLAHNRGFFNIGEAYNSGVPGTYFEYLDGVKILHYMYKPNTAFSEDKIDPRFTNLWLKYFNSGNFYV